MSHSKIMHPFPISLEKIIDKRQTHIENILTILPNEKRKVTCLIGDRSLRVPLRQEKF